ncbi:glycosyltransferase family 2 protein [Paraburkholderia adhaesiva]|uniref:glycosyltransferase family 2 protein n=1 Tax=Paraburkholderia adhaesiva TaxID=2883244 RepID=UPI001F159369|nr:glycosyltransferase family 2 protein [Paraburkholderia adhaesiva]
MLCDLDHAYDVSVIIPHYETLDLLRLAIDSISSQTIVPREIIVIDDASELQFELPGHCGDNIALRLIRETENRGAAWCRNKGIEEATGDIVAFLDADDRWLPDKLERCVTAFGPKPDEHEARVLFSNVLLNDGTRRILGNRSPYDGQSMLDFILLEGGYIQTSSIMMWRHQYPMISFDESLRRHQDWDFAIKAEMAGCEFVYLHDALVEYYLTSGGSRISMVLNCEPSLDFFEKHHGSMSKKHVSAFVFNVLIYKKMSIAVRLAIVEKIILKEIEIPSKGWMLLFVRLVIGRGVVDWIKQLRRIVQIGDYST